jgi:prepilin-type N-terminal cleavage/methylation domain-containing protein
MDDRRGFTLLEVLVSLAILSITLLLAYEVLSGAIGAEDRSERWTVASCLGETLVRESTAVWPERESSGSSRPRWGVLLKVDRPATPDTRGVTSPSPGPGAGRRFLSGVAIK